MPELFESGLREIFPYLLKLECAWDFEGKTAWGLEQEIKDSIRERPEKELTDDESPER
ncbi:MAG TPA: hypothetical protein VLE22_04050 [Bryobacteraceae bacterium]|nr:hypothetical protein [Bryobacteraceae bacterium]